MKGTWTSGGKSVPVRLYTPEELRNMSYEEKQRLGIDGEGWGPVILLLIVVVVTALLCWGTTATGSWGW